ncbi:MAG: pentapeptide repeat-containing protein [Elainellaceae cyanobacterium]
MTERGKYHGQRLKAQDVLRLYAAGERDFRGAILRGCSFRGADLSGADFSGADLRSARFVDATLQNAKFCGAQAGLQRRWWLGQLGLVIFIAILTGLLQGFTGSLIGSLLIEGGSVSTSTAIAAIIVIVVTFFAIVRQGFTLKALGIVAVAGAFAVAVAGTVAVAIAFAFSGTVAVAGAFAFVVAFAFAFAFVVAGAVAGAVAFAVAGAFAVAFAMAVVSTIAGAVAVAVAVAGIVAVATLLLSIYINQCIYKRVPKFENLRIIGLACAALGGTTFSGADLSSTSFSHAYLQRTNFADSRHKPTTLTHVRWHHAQKLDQARLGSSILQDPRVCTLLTTLNGIDHDLSHANLRGANLANAQLHRIRLNNAMLNGATLEGAELHGAILTEAQCIATNFTAAHLTGACLEAWNIDETTILKDVDCQHIFLKEKPDDRGDRERRPHNLDKDFQPGDFEKFFKETLDTVQILIRNGIDPAAFRTAFKKVTAENPDVSRDSIQGFERQGQDILLTLQVPSGTDKAKIERTWDEGYQLGLKEGYHSGLLEGQTQRANDLKEVMLSFTQNPLSIHNMNNPINTGDGSFYAGGDVNLTGSTLNLGEISGQVSNQINQLPDAAPTPDQPSLKTLLLQLKAAIETDTELSDDEKAEALGEVAKLVKAGSDPKESTMQRLAKRATATLKSIAEPLTEASKLATACTSLLPMILALF